MTDIDRILVTPRWAGTIDDDWYPWLATELGEPPIVRVPLPNHQAPVIADCRDAFAAVLDQGDPRTTLCVGHSVSVQAWLHTLAASPSRPPVAGLVAVAGWWTIDSAWEPLVPWLEAEHDLAAIRRACPNIRVLISENDPYTGNHEENAQRWRTSLGASVTLIADAAHFNGRTEAEVLRAIKAFHPAAT